MKKWKICRPDEKVSKKLSVAGELSSLCADVLVSRGISDISTASDFLNAEELEDPFVLRDMDKAVSVINEAVENGSRICIYGDYDCDGVTSTVILYSYLECIGADVDYYIPERSEGYGLNMESVRKIASEGTELIITVDNGISAFAEAELIKQLGMKLVITDHHQPGESIPQADAVVDPHRTDCPGRYKNLCGAGVALKLVAALDGGDYSMALEQFGDLAAIGTVADVVELTGENRFIVQLGLQYAVNTERCGLVELMKIAGLKNKINSPGGISSTDVAFMIAPRLNAAGRFGSPRQAFELLMCDDPDEAQHLASELHELNRQRRETEQSILSCIYDEINRDPRVLSERVLVFSGDDWHHGVIGIVAARIEEQYGKPCFIITREGEMSRGSARAFGEFSVFGCLEACSEVLSKFGGHQGAGGFSLKTSDIERFTELIQGYAAENHPEMPVMTVTADKLLMPADITVKNVQSLEILEPFGEGNRQPLFALTGAVVEKIIPLSEGAHTRLRINYGGVILTALLFRTRPEDTGISENEKWDFIASLDINEYNGIRSVALNVSDFRRSGINQESFFAAGMAYEKYIRNEPLPEAYYQRMTPQREELVKVYSAVSEKPVKIIPLFSRFDPKVINYCKFRICLDIFRDTGLIRIDHSNDTVSRLKVTAKVNLENSKTLRELNEKWGMKAVQ